MKKIMNRATAAVIIAAAAFAVLTGLAAGFVLNSNERKESGDATQTDAAPVVSSAPVRPSPLPSVSPRSEYPEWNDIALPEMPAGEGETHHVESDDDSEEESPIDDKTKKIRPSGGEQDRASDGEPLPPYSPENGKPEEPELPLVIDKNWENE